MSRKSFSVEMQSATTESDQYKDETIPRRALVTGAASGIGLATSRLLLGEGVSVVGVDINESGLTALDEEGATVISADISEPNQLDQLITTLDPVDYLVNAAGIVRMMPISEAVRDDWDATFAVNAAAVFFLCQGIGQRINPGGAIVNISSSSAKLATTTEVAIYAASKAAVLSITRSFAYSLAPRGVRVNAVSPGIVDTPMERSLISQVAEIRGTTPEALSAERDSTVPLQRASAPEEIASVIWFLLSEASSYMTGQALNATGGQVMW